MVGGIGMGIGDGGTGMGQWRMETRMGMRERG